MRIRTAGRRVIEFICQIRVRGHLGETIRSGFPALRARTEGEDTVLSGVLADQAALYGVLAQCEALGLELLDVRRLDQPGSAPQSGTDHTRDVTTAHRPVCGQTAGPGESHERRDDESPCRG